MRKAVLANFLICLSFISSYGAKVDSVSILSKWGGLGKAQESALVIFEKKGKYYAKGKETQSLYIANLEKAIDSLEIPNLSLENLGVSQEWLKENTEPAYAEYFTYGDVWVNEKQKQLFRTSFQDIQLMERVINSYARGGWTDDNPNIEIVIKRGNETIRLFSDGQASFMLPWEITKSDRKVITYNADVTRAIVNLLPRKFTNRDRLIGNGFRRALAQSLIDGYLHKEWDSLKN
jgi:hypothetical protein